MGKARSDRTVTWERTLTVDDAFDLRFLRQHVRRFLAGTPEPVVADAMLAAVMLAGDACRRAGTPVIVRLLQYAETPRMRIEVCYHPPVSAEPPPEDFRAVILDRITNDHGVERSDDGTTTWAEVALAVAA